MTTCNSQSISFSPGPLCHYTLWYFTEMVWAKRVSLHRLRQYDYVSRNAVAAVIIAFRVSKLNNNVIWNY